MKLLRLNMVLVVPTWCSSTRAAPVTNDHANIQEAMAILQHEMSALKENVRTQQERMERVEAENADLRKTLNVYRQITADSMFLATISEFIVEMSPGDPIIWDSAPINPGGNFDAELGAYTAPVNGYYTFSVAKAGNDYYGDFIFLVDDVQYAYVDENTEDSNLTPTVTGSINIELTAGQTVRIENQGSFSIYGSDESGMMYSWFTGHLLYAL